MAAYTKIYQRKFNSIEISDHWHATLETHIHAHHFKLVGKDWSMLSSPSYTYTHCFITFWFEHLK